MIVRWSQLRRAASEAITLWVFVFGMFLSEPVSYFLTIVFARHVLGVQCRYAGVRLECCGLCLVVVGLETTRQEFGQPTTPGLIASWVKLFTSALKKPETQTIQVHSAGHAHISTGDMTLIQSAPKD